MDRPAVGAPHGRYRQQRALVVAVLVKDSGLRLEAKRHFADQPAPSRSLPRPDGVERELVELFLGFAIAPAS